MQPVRTSSNRSTEEPFGPQIPIKPPSDKWSRSDKLAVALACAGASMALIVSLAEKTPLTVGIMIACIATLMVYPVIHFVSSRKFQMLALLVMIAVVAIFGWSVWPKKMQAVRTSLPGVQPPAETSQNPPSLANQSNSPAKKKKKNDAQELPLPTNAAPPIQINNAPNGIAIGGGTVTNPTVNNFAPPERTAPPQLATCISSLPHMSAYLVFADYPDAETQRYASQVYDVFNAQNKVSRLGHNFGGTMPRGVHVLVHDTDDEHYQTAQQLVKTLVGCGMQIDEFASAAFVPKGQIRIVFGTR